MLKAFFDKFALRQQRRRLDAKNPLAAEVRRLVPKCLVCKADTALHRFAEVASMPCDEGTKPRVMALFHHVKKHEWEPLKGFREFIGDRDDVIVYAVTGPHEGGMVILIRDPFELYARAEIYLEEMVTADEVARIKALVPPDDWQEL